MLNKLLVLIILIGCWQWWQRTQTVAPMPESFPVSESFPVPDETVPAQPQLQLNQSFKCDGRQYCSQMRSKAEAEFFIANCPDTKMDGDHDGDPCEMDSRWRQ